MNREESEHLTPNEGLETEPKALKKVYAFSVSDFHFLNISGDPSIRYT